MLDELESAGGNTAEVADYAAKGRFHKGGANCGLRPYGIAQLLTLPEVTGKNKASKVLKGLNSIFSIRWDCRNGLNVSSLPFRMNRSSFLWLCS